MKKILCIVLVIVFCFYLPSIARADNTSVKIFSEKPTQGIESPYPDHGRGYSLSNDTFSTQASNVILGGDNYIRKLSSKEISGFAKTFSNVRVDTIGYVMNFQVWDGYNWVNYAESYKKAYNHNSVSGFHDKSATSGLYYRLKVIHYYQHNGVFKSTTSYSEYIYLN